MTDDFVPKSDTGNVVFMGDGTTIDLMDEDLKLPNFSILNMARVMSVIPRYGAQFSFRAPKTIIGDISLLSLLIHSLRVAAMTARKKKRPNELLVRRAALHDCAEVVLNDHINPVKTLLKPIIGPLEHRIHAAICKSQGLSDISMPAEIKEMDFLCYLYESVMIAKDANFASTHQWEIRRQLFDNGLSTSEKQELALAMNFFYLSDPIKMFIHTVKTGEPPMDPQQSLDAVEILRRFKRKEDWRKRVVGREKP